jgi:replication factor A1
MTEYLAYLSVKNNIYLAELFHSLISAKENGKTNCQDLTVECRGSAKNGTIFLITKNSAIVAQFRVAEEFLLRKDIIFENWMDTDKIRKQIRRQTTTNRVSVPVQELRHGMKKVNILAQVIEKPTPSLIHTPYGNIATVANIWIADETGKVKLSLWNEQATSVALGDTIEVKNASVGTYKGQRQLRIGKNGSISVLQSQQVELKEMEKAANPKLD